MSIFEQKEKNLNKLIDKLTNLTSTYSQSSYERENLQTEKNELLRQKLEIEKKNKELMREHRYLKEKLASLKNEVKNKSIIQDKFNQDIEDLSQETENLVNEIEKMANVNIKFNNKDYLLSCDDGQEESLKNLTKYLDKKYKELRDKLGNIGENKLLLITTIQLIDEYFDLKQRVTQQKKKIDEIASKFQELKASQLGIKMERTKKSIN